MRDRNCLTPSVVFSGSEAFVVAERMVLFEVDDLANLPSALLALYFGFNIQYMQGHKSLLLFLEYALRGTTHTKMTITAESTIAAMSRLA